MGARSISADEKRWRAESDAYTLIEAENIKVDKSRLNSALKEAKNIAKRKEKEATLAKKAAGKITNKPVNKNKTRKKK